MSSPNRRRARLLAVTSVVAWHVVEVAELPGLPAGVRLWNGVVRFCFFVITSSLLTRQRAAMLREQAMARAPLFASLPPRDLRSLAEVTSVERHQAGSTMVKEGAAGTAFFVILEGRAKVVIGSRGIAGLGPGDFFGEISLLDGDPRTASVVADCLGDTDEGVRRSAMAMLLKLKRDVVPHLVKLLRDKNLEVRRGAAAALAELGPKAKDAAPALIEALKDSDAAIRLSAVLAMKDKLPVTVIHGDFAEWNVHYRHGRLAGVIDFGLAHLDSRPCELAVARTWRASEAIDAYRGELARNGWPLSTLEEAAIGPLYHAFRLGMAASELDAGLSHRRRAPGAPRSRRPPPSPRRRAGPSPPGTCAPRRRPGCRCRGPGRNCRRGSGGSRPAPRARPPAPAACPLALR